MLDPAEIHQVFVLSQCQNETINCIGIERIDPEKDPFQFDLDKLEDFKDRITSWFQEMDMVFFKKSGGGWAYHNMTHDKRGILWTEDLEIIEELIGLGIAIGKCQYLLPRENWINAIPYIVINPLYDF